MAKIHALKVYRDNVKRLVDRMDEYDHIFPQHFMNNIENNLMPRSWSACDAILANPEKSDYTIETWGKNASEPTVKVFQVYKGLQRNILRL